MLAAAKAGDERAKRVTHRYQHRPEFELFDCVADPLQMANLAADERYAGTVKELKTKLDAWMTSQGDQGIETELDAKNHQGGGRKKKSAAAKGGKGKKRDRATRD